MNILITGGAGYIGSHTCIQLINAGFTPIIYDNFSNSSREVINRLEIICETKFIELDPEGNFIRVGGEGIVK